MDETEKSAPGRLYVPAVVVFTIVLIYFIRSAPVAQINFLGPGIALIIVFTSAFLFETSYTSYAGILPSIVLLYLLTKESGGSIPWLLKTYIDLGLILGIASFIVYHKTKVKGVFYYVVFYAYSLKTVFPLFLGYFILGSFTHPYFIYSFIVMLLLTWVFYLEAGI